MKYLFTICLCGLFLFACDQTKKDGITEESPQQPAEEDLTIEKLVRDSLTGQIYMASKPKYALSSAIGPEPKKIVDPIPVKLIPPNPQTDQEKKVHEHLTQETWVVWSLVRIKRVPETRQNQGAWFRFNPDGTYEYGFWEEPISTGTWWFDGRAGQLNLDSNLKSDDRQWKVQLARTGDVMVWTGTEKYLTTDITLKLERFFTVPKTRAELGVTE